MYIIHHQGCGEYNKFWFLVASIILLVFFLIKDFTCYTPESMRYSQISTMTVIDSLVDYFDIFFSCTLRKQRYLLKTI